MLCREPGPQLGVQRCDIVPPDTIEIGRQRAARRIEEATIDGVGVGTADETQGCDVMRRRHPRVRRVKLIGPAAPAELGRDLVDPLGHDQDGAVGGLGEEIAQRPLETPRQDDALALLGDECKRAVDRQYAGGIGGEQGLARRNEITRPEVLRAVRNEIDDLRDLLHGALRLRDSTCTGWMRIAWPPPGASAMCSTEFRVTMRCEIATGSGLVSPLAPGPSA